MAINLYKGPARPATSIEIFIDVPEKGIVNKKVGAIEAFDRTISRDVYRRREFDVTNPGEVPGAAREVVPGPSTVDIGIRRAVLYASALLEECGFKGIEDLIAQNIHFDIVEKRYKPDGTLQQEIRYKDCLFTSNPISYDLTREFIVFQDADIAVRTVEVLP